MWYKYIWCFMAQSKCKRMLQRMLVFWNALCRELSLMWQRRIPGCFPKQDSWWVCLCHWSCVLCPPAVEWSPKEVTGPEAVKGFDLMSLFRNCHKCIKVRGVHRYALPQPRQSWREPGAASSGFLSVPDKKHPYFGGGPMRWNKMRHVEIISKRESGIYFYS